MAATAKVAAPSEITRSTGVGGIAVAIGTEVVEPLFAHASANGLLIQLRSRGLLVPGAIPDRCFVSHEPGLIVAVHKFPSAPP